MLKFVISFIVFISNIFSMTALSQTNRTNPPQQINPPPAPSDVNRPPNFPDFTRMTTGTVSDTAIGTRTHTFSQVITDTILRTSTSTATKTDTQYLLK